MAGASELGGFKIETNFKIFDTKCYCNYNKHKGSQGCIGDRGSSVVQVLCYKSEGGLIPADVIGIFHWHKILLITLWPWGRLSLWQKWVPGAFPVGKAGRCVRLITLPPSCTDVMKSGNLNFLEPSGPIQACNGTALPFYICTHIHTQYIHTYTHTYQSIYFVCR